MLYEQLRTEIRTGDLLGVHSVQWYSRIIEQLTGKGDKKSWSHVGVFYWSGEGLWIAQEYEGTGFGCYPASQLISKFMREKGQCFLGRAPEEVTANPQKVLDVIALFRRTPSLDPYGYGTLLRVLFKEKINPTSVQAVCSTFAQETWERCGLTFPRLYAPEDFKSVVGGVTSIE